MPSPFPGMDPYLEQPTLWPSLHFRLIGAIAAAIEPQLSSQYYVEVETRTYQGEATEDLLIGIADAAIVASCRHTILPPNTRRGSYLRSHPHQTPTGHPADAVTRARALPRGTGSR
jgi:hypothetical protein